MMKCLTILICQKKRLKFSLMSHLTYSVGKWLNTIQEELIHSTQRERYPSVLSHWEWRNPGCSNGLQSRCHPLNSVHNLVRVKQAANHNSVPAKQSLRRWLPHMEPMGKVCLRLLYPININCYHMVSGTQEQMRSGNKYAIFEEVISLSLILFPFNDKTEIRHRDYCFRVMLLPIII